MARDDFREALPEHYSGTGSEKIACSDGPLNKREENRDRSTNLDQFPINCRPVSLVEQQPNVDHVELNVDDNYVSVYKFNTTTCSTSLQEDSRPLSTSISKGHEKDDSFGSSVAQITSSRIKKLSRELKSMVSLSKPTQPPPARFGRTKSAATHALKSLKFISKADCSAGWPAVEKRFKQIAASTNGSLPRFRFGECIGMNKDSEEFAGELFDALARQRGIKGDFINMAQLKEFWEQISDQSFDSRLRTFFDMVDKDADGRITEAEVREIISHSASANKLVHIQNQADEYASLIMEALDPENDGFIMIEDLEKLLLQGRTESLRAYSGNLSQTLSKKLNRPTQYSNLLSKWYESTEFFLRDNWKKIWVITLWIGVMLGLFVNKFMEYRKKAAYEVMGSCVCVAKGAAETLKLNMALILLPVCRNTITWLRNKTKLGLFIPFDDNLRFHQVIAVGITVGVVVHTVFHLACDFPRLINASSDKYRLMVPFFGQQPSNYWYFVKSVEGVTGFLMIALMAISFTLAAPWFRQSSRNLPKLLKQLTGFNAFWYSHHLFVIVYALLIVHGVQLYLTKEWYQKTTWMYLVVPLTLYICERLIRALRSSGEPVKILKIAIYSGDVLALYMTKPLGFSYRSGQYMFVNCAAVSPFEWHPFSFTSAPQDDYLSVHIRIVGDWTKKLRAVFAKVCKPSPRGKSGLQRADCYEEDSITKFPRVIIDGPYGAPAQEFKNYEVVLLIGLGIGATPMISIVKDIANNIKAMEDEEDSEIGNSKPSATALTTSKDNKAKEGGETNVDFKTRRTYFYWVTKDPGSFEWFKDVMNEVAEMDNKGVIELHNYCTSVYEEGDARSALISMLQSLHHAKKGVDVISGTRVKSHFAKPKWPTVFDNISRNHTHAEVGVFYCGPPAAAKELHQLATGFSHNSTTKFDFHKENF